jgi:chromosome segregation ATPase
VISAEGQPPPTPPREFFDSVTPETAAPHLEWIQSEVERFNRFVAQQLQIIERTRLDLARADSQSTAAMLAREQDLNREKAVLSARSAALSKQEAELSKRRIQLEARVREIEGRERSIQKRLKEVEEIEESLRAEIEESERDVQRQRLAVEELADSLRSRVASAPAATPDLIDSLRSILQNLEAGARR